MTNPSLGKLCIGRRKHSIKIDGVTLQKRYSIVLETMKTASVAFLKIQETTFHEFQKK